MGRVIAWFSCGAASACAAKSALAKYPDAMVVRIRIPSEHPDNDRFSRDVSEWLGREIVELQSEKYADHWDVILKERFLVGPYGARCTTELKKNIRRAFQLPDDLHVFGYTSEKPERNRFKRLKNENLEVTAWAPLIDETITKAQCLDILELNGIALPAMYLLGYQNNNCIGCVKGGMGYWNKIRKDFPEVFERMAKVEQELGRTVLRKGKKLLPLTELDPEAGRYEPIRAGCGVLCGE